MRIKLLTSIILSLFLYVFTAPGYAYNNKGFLSERERVINRTLCQLALDQQYGSFSDEEQALEVVDSQEDQTPDLEYPSPKHTWELGTEISNITYKEPGLMKDEGTMYGIVGSYTYRGWAPPASKELDKWRLRLEVRYSYGEVDYKGALSDGTPYEMDDIDDYMWEIRGLWGYEFPMFKASTIIPYFGFGYRYLNDNSSNDPYGYKRESNYYYSPIGIEIITDLDRGWFVGATLEFDIFWSGEQVSYLSDVSPGYNDPENDQDRGYGCRASIELQKKCKRIDFVIEPFIRYWNIRESDPALITWYGVPYAYGVEPKNNSTEYGLKVAVRF